jgi:GNAT superfamily N-acetyltransferase
MTEFEVRLITAAETIPIRWPVLRAGLPREAAVFEGDEAPDALHFGAFRGDELTGVVSIYPRPFPERPELANCWQLRGMAVTPGNQRRGVGVALLRTVTREVRSRGGELLWCNARVPAVRFYEKQGWRVIGGEFEIPTAGPHSRMWVAVAAA